MNNTISSIMWLQLFADPVLIAPDANGTVSSGSTGKGPENPGLSPEMKIWYNKYIIEKAGPELIHDQFAEKVPLPKGKGKTVEFHEFVSYPKAMTPLSEGVTPLGRAMEVNAITATIEQYGDFTKLTDILDMTAVDPVLARTVEEHARQMGLTLDTVTRNALNSGTRVMYCQDINNPDTAIKSRSALTASCKLTVDTIMQAVTAFEASNVPKINGKYVALINPYAKYDLMRDPEWIDAHKYANPDNLYDGEIGEIAGVRFVQSSECKIFCGTDDGCPDGLAVFSTILLGAKAYATTELEGGAEVIVKPRGAGDDPLNQRSTAGWKAAKVSEILVQDYIMRIESCSPRYSATVKEAN